MRLLLISSSNVAGYGYLDQPEPFIRDFCAGLRRVAFIPFAAHDHAAYTQHVRERFARMELDVVPIEELDRADAIFSGGGNTFRLLKTMYERELLEPVRQRVRGGMPYMGSSAGTNLACPTIRTTNDMPIVWPPSLDALGFVPFQINPHYADPDPSSRHQGETREQRIREFHEEHDTPVAGLREGSLLRVDGPVTTLLGDNTARLFRRGIEPEELAPGAITI